MRHYPQYPSRSSMCLNGTWDFAWLGDQVDDASVQPSSIQYTEFAAVPGVFDTYPSAPGRRGVGVYRRQVAWRAGAPLRLRIGGMGLAARIWWDGELIGDYRLPYSSVDYDFDSGDGQYHELVIAVDNRFDVARSPLFSPNFDFYAYGGVYREIELQELPETRLERVRVTTLDIDTGRVRLQVIPGGNVPDELTFSVAFDRNAPIQFTEKVVDGAAIIERDTPNHQVWSPANPALHTVTVSMGDDVIVERFGVRSVTTRGQEILVNGEPVRLLGVNRHESHPEFGPVQPEHLMVEDLRQIKELGCNFIRCVHYPHDQAFLDLCDQFGFLVWQESMGWGNTAEDASNPDFHALQVEQTRLMVQNGFNHPSIILWGFLNECCSETEEGKKLYGDLAQTIRDENPEFLVTYASNKHERDICFEFADVIAMNFYPGWISETDFNVPSTARIKSYLDAKAEYAQKPDLVSKPFIVGEIGACGIYGAHDRTAAQWTEEFQRDYFTEACRSVLSNPRFAGLALWQMFDARSFVNVGGIRSKPFGVNLAGLVDAYRRPKLAYDAVKEIYRGES